jgi:hypothetical protein
MVLPRRHGTWDFVSLVSMAFEADSLHRWLASVSRHKSQEDGIKLLVSALDALTKSKLISSSVVAKSTETGKISD